ncbi:MAG: type II toxin-antitoxin system VapB family antitoxin [Betaproteobacteria bacterium]|nr:MAG: type II toxin-antitoxin system VapB family antitoxin [Betaproteobacteria bacterium]TAG45219.1 MAG: type II toxin-antitoxin system VapB family antitoxin [Betaproteobacteria bacterium]
MRTNIVIDDALMTAAMRAGDFKTKKDAVEEGLRLLARRKAYQDIRAARGALQWSVDGDWSGSPAAPSVQQPRDAYGVSGARSAATAATKSKPLKRNAKR